MTYPISEIDGLPSFAASKLKSLGIRTTEGLLEAARTVKGRKALAAKSGISKSVPPGEVHWGSPAMPIKEAKEQLAYVRRLPKLYERVKRLENAEQKPRTDGKSFPEES